MLHDENVYPEPFQFKPERFLTADGLNMDTSVRDINDMVWGFGRRFVQWSSKVLWELIIVTCDKGSVQVVSRPNQLSGLLSRHLLRLLI